MEDFKAGPLFSIAALITLIFGASISGFTATEGSKASFKNESIHGLIMPLEVEYLDECFNLVVQPGPPRLALALSGLKTPTATPHTSSDEVHSFLSTKKFHSIKSIRRPIYHIHDLDQSFKLKNVLTWTIHLAIQLFYRYAT